jgi:hypothetical protein
MNDEILKEIQGDIKTMIGQLSGMSATVVSQGERIVRLEQADRDHERDINECHAKHREHEGAQKTQDKNMKIFACVGTAFGIVLVFAQFIDLIKE